MSVKNTIGKFLLIQLSFIIPKQRNKWVFGSNMGFSNNSKYLFLYMNKYYPKINTIWISRTKKECLFIRSLNLKCYYRYSLLGLFHSYSARVYIFNSYVGDINPCASRKTLKVNLWHGIGIKKIERMIDNGPLSIIFRKNSWIHRLKYYNHFIKPDLFLSTSDEMTNHFSKCFDIPKSDCIEAIYPRCQLFLLNHNDLIEYITHNEPKETLDLIDKITQYNRTYIYMPTWRDSGTSFFKNSKINIQELNETLIKSSSLFIFKLHPLDKVDIDMHLYSNILFLDSKFDVYPILPFTNSLITDYSSILYDYLLFENKEIILFPFDLKDYLSNSRDFAYDYTANTTSLKYYNFLDLLKHIDSNKLCLNTSMETYIRSKFWGDTTKGNNYIIKRIFQKLEYD